MSTRARTTSRVLAILAAAAISVGIPSTPAYGYLMEAGTQDVIVDRGGGYRFKWAEKCMMRKINRVRTRNGYSGLQWDRQLGYVARRHAYAMASNGYVYHDGDLGREVTRWRRLGQNTGRGSSCKRLFWAFMRSSSHRSNIFGAWRHMGVGVEYRRGNLYVQQIFESRYDPGNVYRYP